MIRVLLCTEQRADRALAESFLREVSRRYSVEWAPSYSDAWVKIRENDHAVVVADADLGTGRGLELLNSMLTAGISTPFVLLLGGSERPDVEAAALRAGAAAILIREEVTPNLLERTVRHAIARASARTRGTDPFSIVASADVLDRIELAMLRAKRTENGFAVLSLSYDMPSSARVDVESHGGVFFGTLAERIRRSLGSDDALFRTGKHEFIVLVESLEKARGAEDAAKCVLDAMSEPFVIDGRSIELAPQLGVSVHPEHGAKAEALLQFARDAMQAARTGSTTSMRVHGTLRPGAATRRAELRRKLVGADTRGELLLHYQPQVHIANGDVHGVEALMRWKSPDFGLVPPFEFIPLAEEAGLMDDFGAWALREACRQSKAWLDEGAHIRVGVNVSAQQFVGGRLGDVIVEALHSSGLPASLLELEITEGLLLENTDETRTLLKSLRAMGILIAVDDFGTGYASLSYVKRFPMDVIKIDREFVRNLPLDAENAAITSAIVALSHSLGLEVIAEGVENEAEEEFLRALDCRVVQGYLHAKPMAAPDFEAWYRARRDLGRRPREAADSRGARRRVVSEAPPSDAS